VSLLIENHIFLRSGITKPRYIHHRYVDPWLIQSYKIYRLEQESLVPFKDSIYATMQQGENAETDAKDTNLHNKEDANEKGNLVISALYNFIFCSSILYS